jgi:hypothetical protein
MRTFFKTNIFDRVRAGFGLRKSPKLLERAEIAAKQMRYFRLFSQKGSFESLSAPAKRAGFEVIYEYDFDKVASFRWAEGDPDLTFFVSFRDPDAVAVNADSCGDIFGLTMTSISDAPKIVVEAKAWLTKREFGRNAQQFRPQLLKHPDFASVAEEPFSRYQKVLNSFFAEFALIGIF